MSQEQAILERKLVDNSFGNNLGSGEDPDANVLKVEQRYSPYTLRTSGTFTILRSIGGQLHNINSGLLSCPTITIYDNASGASGTILAHIEAGQKGNYVYNVTFVNGATAWVTSGNSFILPLGIR